MGDYYNKGRGPLAITLRSGIVVTVPPKSWIAIDSKEEGAAALLMYLSRGVLIKGALASESKDVSYLPPEPTSPSKQTVPLTAQMPNSSSSLEQAETPKALDETASDKVETTVTEGESVEAVESDAKSSKPMARKQRK